MASLSIFFPLFGYSFHGALYPYPIMILPFAAVIVIAIALFAGALGLTAFLWAIRTKQFSIQQLNKGASVIFDEDEPVGKPQDMTFRNPHGDNKN